MKLSLLATACVALAQASFVAATYFTSPQPGDTISNAGGLKVTWKYQPGGAPKGTCILETVQASARQNTQVVIASEVDLVNTASVTIPIDLNARKSSTNTYFDPSIGTKGKKLRQGQNPKKSHEVDRFSHLVQEIRSTRPGITNIIDVGSGRLDVLAVDWSSQQISGSEYLETLGKARSAPNQTEVQPSVDTPATSPVPEKGTLTHLTSSLDAPSIAQLYTLPQAAENAEPPARDVEPAMLVTLHGCGDLTISALQVLFLAPCPLPTAILVGCCYNLQTPSSFPLSDFVARALDTTSLGSETKEPMTRLHLRISPQSPGLWCLTPTSQQELKESIVKLGYRARLEAELAAQGLGSEGQRRVGRVSKSQDFDDYRLKALRKYGETEVPRLRFGSDEMGEEKAWIEALYQLQVFWTLRCHLGPVLETLLVLDRFAFLVERLGEVEQEQEQEQASSRRSLVLELRNLFDQSSGSVRNMALVLR
ncbi:BZ3500_MvSof-1268-A1-R1_Chr1-3g02282 [Microbotryum saponariae]|uniref:BZ3500_MvSof-1268-A1-R1_Chr1-3g02282 protein n=1 Tax=Microbotryum saponariae TaxID=289078 RepID=A0A2X0KD24_9BASI|nr:BZ3500_MvSof-1268-A1-R1_Chr1-3g02282 [Microbotryum saponariae]SCZ95864.1 BZ3501_MvSof-1269-A2-R1_Chr1-3g01885 [Microbotryum saponariae]